MGAWGHESSANDSCWDALGDCGVDFDAEVMMNEVKLNQGLHKVSDLDDFLGCVTWGLDNGCVVNEQHLERAREIAKDKLESGEERGWRDPEERKRCLKYELSAIETALEGNKVPERHVKGLFERIAESSKKQKG